jgi:hypothetical protein
MADGAPGERVIRRFPNRRRRPRTRFIRHSVDAGVRLFGRRPAEDHPPPLTPRGVYRLLVPEFISVHIAPGQRGLKRGT